MGTRQRRQQEAVQRRQSILDAAREVFWKEGYAGTTMPRVAEVAQLAPGTLYLYFRSKDALYAELLAEGYDVLVQRLTESVDPAASPRQQAGALIDVFFDFARQYPEYFEIMFFVLQKEGANRERRLQPDQVQRLKEKENQCKAIAQGVLKRAGYAPSARRSADAVDAVWSMIAGVIFYFRNERGFDAVAAEARRLLLAAIFPGF